MQKKPPPPEVLEILRKNGVEVPEPKPEPEKK